MSSIQVAGKTIELDDEGFMVDPTLWDDDVAVALAKNEVSGDLTDDHWKVIRHLREYFTKYGLAPMQRKLAKDTGLELKRINQLFPNGPAKGACKVAGLPKPTGCL